MTGDSSRKYKALAVLSGCCVPQELALELLWGRDVRAPERNGF
jgi:hypothetical protein